LRCESNYLCFSSPVLTSTHRPTLAIPDPDLREYQRGNALAGISGRKTATGLRPLATRPVRAIDRKDKSKRSFNLAEAIESSVTDSVLQSAPEEDSDDDDDMIAYAIQASLDQSSPTVGGSPPGTSQKRTPKASTSTHVSREERVISDDDNDDDDMYVDFAPPTRLESALALANANHSVRRPPSNLTSKSPANTSMFGQSTLLMTSMTPGRPPNSRSRSLFGTSTLLASSSNKSHLDPISMDEDSESDDDMELVASVPQDPVPLKPSSQENDSGLVPEAEVSTASFQSFAPIGSLLHPQVQSHAASGDVALSGAPPTESHNIFPAQEEDVLVVAEESEDDMEEVIMDEVRAPRTSAPTHQDGATHPIEESDDDMEEVPVQAAAYPTRLDESAQSPQLEAIATSPSSRAVETVERDVTPDELLHAPSPQRARSMTTFDNEPLFTLSRSPSPSLSMDMGASRPGSPHQHTMDEWDAADEMDVHAEQGEFANFMSQVKGRNVDEIRKEIDAEIQDLNKQRKAAMRDSEDITHQMISQIMVCVCRFQTVCCTSSSSLIFLGDVKAVWHSVHHSANGG
jgi:DNA excision repair protein ERCC-5